MKSTVRFYITTGKKNAMYTLRQTWLNDSTNNSTSVFVNNHICTLSSDEDKAILKAKNFVDGYRERVGETENFKIELDPNPHCDNFKRKGKLSVKDTHTLNIIESGIFPIGKNKNTKIEDAEDTYILYWVDKLNEEISEVLKALSAYCLGIALERGIIAKREEKRKEQLEKDLLSEFIGNVGERMEFSGKLISSNEEKIYFEGEGYVGNGIFKNRFMSGNNIVYYKGKKLGEVGDEIKIKATIKSNYEKNNVKMTIVNRPIVL